MRIRILDLPDHVLQLIVTRCTDAVPMTACKRLWEMATSSGFDRMVAQTMCDRVGHEKALLRACSTDGKSTVMHEVILLAGDPCDDLAQTCVTHACRGSPAHLGRVLAALRRWIPWEREWFEMAVYNCTSLETACVLLDGLRTAMDSDDLCADWTRSWRRRRSPCENSIVDCATDVAYDHASELVRDACARRDVRSLTATLMAAQWYGLHPHDLLNDCLVYAAGQGNLKLIKRLCNWGASAYCAAIREGTWEGRLHVVRYLARRAGMSHASLAEAMGVSLGGADRSLLRIFVV